jgi:hypothetical protein
VQSSPVQSSPVRSGPVRSGPVQSSPVQSSPVQPDTYTTCSGTLGSLPRLLPTFSVPTSSPGARRILWGGCLFLHHHQRAPSAPATQMTTTTTMHMHHRTMFSISGELLADAAMLGTRTASVGADMVELLCQTPCTWLWLRYESLQPRGGSCLCVHAGTDTAVTKNSSCRDPWVLWLWPQPQPQPQL